ncbi:MAG: PKD domain-containing protein, partial [Clostridia bacterium]|nr:PKD domain-containing protein [Clostridia bacterium]
YIDPAYPTLGFDLDAVVALNAGIIPYGEILSPDADAVIVIGLNPYDEFIDFDAIYWDDDFDNVQWAVRRASSVPNNPNTVWGNVDGRNDPFDWDGHIFHSTADATTWLADLYYAFVWNPVEDVGEPNIRLVRSFRIDAWPTVDSISSPNVTSLDVNITVSATGSDPDGDVLSYSWDFDNDEEFDDAVGPAPLFPAGSVPRIQTIKVKVEDPYGAYAIGQTEVVVNACPTVSIAGPYLTAVDTTIQLEATGYDPGPEPIDLSYAWDFDNDGEFDDATGATTDYTAGLEAGIYSVSVRVTDQYNCSDEVETTVVVYDPDGGFVTGGGWIYSQPGAYLEDPEMEGKATFGFVSKYQKKSTIPLGNTEFQFHAGDLNFKSSSYEWLIINQGGTNAQFKGYGTINGQGSYMFMIWATDDSVDTFRIKIENTADGTIVYDNGAQELCKGSIVIHTK